MGITKTDFMRGMQCRKMLWLDKHKPSLKVVPIERMLPSLGVRYISINDGYDSNKYIGTTDGLDVVLRAIVYDAYSKDLSVKGKTARAIGRKQGRRVSGLPAYGYKRDPEHPAMDVIDPKAAAVVRRIFDYAIAQI